MDTGSSSIPPFTTKDEFEVLEVAEFDANALWELLHDEPGEEEQASGGGAPMQAMEVDSPKPDESYWCLNDFNINVNSNSNSNTVQDFDWFRIMEETSTSCNEMGGWYGEPCTEEMTQILEIGDYSTSQSEILADEIGYIGLWLDN